MIAFCKTIFVKTLHFAHKKPFIMKAILRILLENGGLGKPVLFGTALAFPKWIFPPKMASNRRYAYRE